MSEKLNIVAILILVSFGLVIAGSLLALMVIAFGYWGLLVFSGMVAVSWAGARLMPCHAPRSPIPPPLPTHKHNG